MTLEQIEARLRTCLPRCRTLKATVRFELERAGVLVLDATQAQPTLTHGDRKADCTIRIAPENLLRLIDGTLNPAVAYNSGKLKVQGAMGIAVKLSTLLKG